MFDLRCPRSARFFAVFAVIFGAACSQQQLYGAGQQWQRNECQRLPPSPDRERCLASTAQSYEEYRRQSEQARGGR